MEDWIDPPAVGQAWWAYAQEPLPDPGPEPGSSKEITDRARQRRPRNITTLIFRNYPAQGRRYMAERMQQEGWFEKEGYNLSEWFESAKGNSQGKRVVVGGKISSQEAWELAYEAWKKHGEDNKLLMSESDLQTRNLEADRFNKYFRLPPGTQPPGLREEDLAKTENDGYTDIRKDYAAAKYMFEFNFYRNVSNFHHHYNRSLVERKPETVACRQYFFRADQAYYRGDRLAALRIFETPTDDPAWGGEKLSPLEAWRKLVLLKNEEFRKDSFIQDYAAEVQVQYMQIHDAQVGRRVKKQLGEISRVVPLVPRFTADDPRQPIIGRPFVDDKGESLIEERAMETVLERLGLVVRQRQAPPAGSKGDGPALAPVVKTP